MRWATLTPDPQTSPKHSARSFPVAGCVPSLTCLGCGGLLRTEEQSGSGQHFISGVFYTDTRQDWVQLHQAQMAGLQAHQAPSKSQLRSDFKAVMITM